MMMTRFVLTLLIGLVVSLGALVSSGLVFASNLPACPLDQEAFKDNCFGTYTDSASDMEYTGEFKANRTHGHGTYTFGSNASGFRTTGKYVGESKNGSRHGQGTYTYANGNKHVGEYKGSLRHGQGTFTWARGDKYVGDWKNNKMNGQGTFIWASGDKYVGEYKDNKRHGQGTLTWVDGRAKEGIWKDDEFQYAKKLTPSSSTTQIASSTTTQANTTTSAELEAERLRQELATLKAEKAVQQQTISSDTKLPTITIASTSSNGPQGTVKGRVSDNTGIAEVRVDGQLVGVDKAGNFIANTYVPEGGVSMSIQAVDLAGLSSSMSVRIDRAAVQTAAFRFDRLNPLGRKVARNKDAVAIIVGVSDYKETTARAAYADSDAKVFKDYAIEKLGVPRDRIKTLVNDGADEKDMLLAVKRWLARASKQGKTDVYIFFAGHGLASDDGQKMYLLPYDGAPELLDDTAILRDRLFSDIASANPRSVTVFLDTCYSGTTRGTDMLIASRPIAIKALKQSVPDNFTVFTAAAGDQTAKPLEEAKHGMFSYFLMKGMEGEADKNQDNKITAGELHQYVQSNVIQQSSGSQTPELQGDAERVLVRFQ